MDDLHLSGVHGRAELSANSRDRLSELPDSLLLEVLSLLPMRDVVPTTLLSKRWKDLWTTVPCLAFRNLKSRELDGEFQRFVCGALALWKGVKILKFSLDFTFDPSYAFFLDMCLDFALVKQVEDLDICLLTPCGLPKKNDKYFAPQKYYKHYARECLYSCTSITTLSLVYYKLRIHKNVQWNQLKSLTIGGANPLSGDSLQHILSGAPRLEVLNLSILGTKEDLNIRSASLKMLKIHKNRHYATLNIWAPSLETFEISGVPSRMCLLDVNGSFLTTAAISFCVYTYKKIRQMLSQLLPSILHVEKLTLSYSCIMALVGMKKRRMVVPLLNAKFLTLHASSANIAFGIILEMFPQLTMLHVELHDLSEVSMNDIFSGPPPLEELNLSILKSSKNLVIRSPSLKMLKIYTHQKKAPTGAADDSLLSIWAPNLETLDISGVPFRTSLMHVPSLTNVILGLNPRILLHQVLRGVFDSINHVEKLTLSGSCTKVLLEMKKKDMSMTFPSSVKFLKLYGCAGDEILGVVEMFPKLMKLVVEVHKYTQICGKSCPNREAKELDWCKSLEHRTNFPSPSLQHLTSVEINWDVQCTSIFPVMEIMLENAHMLQTMVFRPIKSLNPELKAVAKEKLLRMPRSSPIAELIIIR